MRKTFRYPFREFFFFASPKAGSHSHVLCLSAKRPLRRGAAGSGARPFAGFRGAAPPGGSRENPANKPPFRRKNHAAWDCTRNSSPGRCSTSSCSASSQPCLSAGVLLFNNNLYSPMLFNGSIASTFRMTSVELQYKPESQWASVLEECGRECGLHFGILILDDMDPPLAAGGPASKSCGGGPHHSPPALFPVRRTRFGRVQHDHARRGT